MARTALTGQAIVSSGLEAALTAANADGHSIPNRAGQILLVRNGAGSDVTVTIPTSAVADGDLAVADRAVVVTAGEDRYITVGAKSEYRQNDGTVYVNFSSVTSVTCALLTVTV